MTPIDGTPLPPAAVPGSGGRAVPTATLPGSGDQAAPTATLPGGDDQAAPTATPPDGGQAPSPAGTLLRARSLARTAIRRVRSDSALGRYGLNAGRRISHRRRPPRLGGVAAATAATLRRDGVASVRLPDLLGDDELLADVQHYVEGLLAARSDRISEQRRRLLGGEPSGLFKSYLVELLGPRPALTPGNPVLRMALHEQVRGIAETYTGCALHVHDVDVWLNLASDSDARASQRWHRDLPEDCDIVKCFLYLRPVEAGTGAMEYARGTHHGPGRSLRLREEWDGIGWRIDEAELARAVSPDRLLRAVGEAGTLVFADTRGLHRGGHAREGDRLLAQVLYATAACSRPRRLVAAEGVRRRDLPEVNLRRRG